MFLTTSEKRRLAVVAIIALIIIAGVALYFYYGASDKITTKETKATPVQQTQDKPVQIKSYTQYDAAEKTCVYNYGEGDCYVPLSFCVNDPKVKTPQELDREKYCSQLPQLDVKSLQSKEGSACPFTGSEGDVINLYSIVRDPDENDPTHKYGPLGKLQVAFSEPFADTDGVWVTQKGDKGIYSFDVSVTDGEYTDTKPYCIEITEGNKPPVLTNVHDKVVLVGQTVTLEPVCTDPDGDKVTITYMGDISDREWMTSNTKQTGPKDIGEHDVTVICRDTRGLPAYKTATITVLAAPPGKTGTLWFETEPKDVVVNEGETITLNPQVHSSLNKPITISYVGWMTSNTKKVSYNDAGDYKVTIVATDGSATIQSTINVKVLNVNRPPEIVGTEEEE
jgi:hypothetical protein